MLFDIDHDGGAKEQTGWVSAQDGVLAMDLNGNGRIDDIGEILSDYFSGAAGSDGNAGEKKYANGFAALKSLDSNADNAFTAADAAWSHVKVWTDANGDALTDAGELKSLGEQGISAIHLTHTLQNGYVNNGNEVLASGSFVRNGSEQQMQAVNFIASAYGQTLSTQGSGTRIDGEAVGGKTTTYIAHSQSGEAMSSAALNAVNLTGNLGNDTLTGDDNANWLADSLGSDTFNAGAANDYCWREMA